MKVPHNWLNNKLFVPIFVIILSFVSFAHASVARVERPLNMLIKLVGTGEAREPDPSIGESGSWCFDVHIVDLKSGLPLGTGADCLEVEPAGDGLKVIGITLFHFWWGDTLVSKGLTSVQPTTHGSEGFTHITGAISQMNDQNVLTQYSTGLFEGAEGAVRLSGAVDMSQFDGKLGSPITFNCIFEINLR